MATKVAKASKTPPDKHAEKPAAHDPVAPASAGCRAPAAEEIRVRAYLRWEAAGRPPGDGSNFWVEAEQEMTRKK